MLTQLAENDQLITFAPLAREFILWDLGKQDMQTVSLPSSIEVRIFELHVIFDSWHEVVVPFIYHYRAESSLFCRKKVLGA